MPHLTIRISGAEWRYLFKEKRVLLLPAAVLLVALTLFVMVLRPQLLAIIKFRREVKVQKKNLGVLSTKAAFLAGIDERGLESQVEAVEQTLPSRNPVLPLIHGLSAIAVETGVGLEGITLRPGELSTEAAMVEKKKTKKGSELMDLKAQLSITGSLEEIEAFLIALDGMAPAVKVEAMNVGQAKKKGMVEQGLLGASFDVIAYYSSLPQQLGKLSEELVELSAQERRRLELVIDFKSYLMETPASFSEVEIGKEDLFSSLE